MSELAKRLLYRLTGGKPDQIAAQLARELDYEVTGLTRELLEQLMRRCEEVSPE